MSNDDERNELLEVLAKQRSSHAAALSTILEATEKAQSEVQLINSDTDDVRREARVAEIRLGRMKQRLIETKRMGASPTGGSAAQVGQVHVELTLEERQRLIAGLVDDAVSSLMAFEEARSRKR